MRLIRVVELKVLHKISIYLKIEMKPLLLNIKVAAAMYWDVKPISCNGKPLDADCMILSEFNVQTYLYLVIWNIVAFFDITGVFSLFHKQSKISC